MEDSAVRQGFWVQAGRWVESGPIQRVIIGLIITNAIILGMETSSSIMAAIGPGLMALDTAILVLFVIELVLRIGYRRAAFFRDAWSLFDLAVVMIALVPASSGLTVLRSLRVLRVLRMITVMPRLKRIVEALLSSLPGLAMIVLLQSLLFYVASVIATKVFGGAFPDWFGTLGKSFYTLFQIMTLESWSMGIVRPVMAEFPYSWAFFIPFILIATFTMLNLFIAVIVNAMQTLHEEENAAAGEKIRAAAHAEAEEITHELKGLRDEIAALRQAVERAGPRGT